MCTNVNKKFSNLSSGYKNILSDIETVIAPYRTVIIDKSINLKKLIKLYDAINSLADQDIDLNSLINNYTKSNDTITCLLALVKIRNKIILKNCTDSSLWRSNLKELTNHFNTIFTDKCTETDVEKALNYLFKKYATHWVGYWTLIDINKKYDVKKIHVFDLNDIDIMKKYMMDYLNYKIK
jgi:hypothetical protein